VPFFVGIPLASALHNSRHGYMSAKEMTMTPLMLMTLISLTPFPIFFIALLAGRWLKPNGQAVA
jgi:hypothetical protein